MKNRNGILSPMDPLYPNKGNNSQTGWAATRRNPHNQNSQINHVNEILGMKKLTVVDKHTLMVKETELNALAQILIDSEYRKYEFIHLELRKILSSPAASGVIQLRDVAKFGLSYYDVMKYLNTLHNANLLLYVQPVVNATAAHVVVNQEARSFLSDTMFSRAAIQAVKKKYNPPQYFFDITLQDQIVSVNLHLDLMWLTRENMERFSLHFAHVFPSPNLMSNPKALGKLVDMADRLRSGFTAIVSPAVDVVALKRYVDMHKNPRTSSIRVVQLNQLNLL